MKLGMIITQTDAETIFNALRLALYSLQQDDEVRIFFPEKVWKSTGLKTRNSMSRVWRSKCWMRAADSWPAAPA